MRVSTELAASLYVLSGICQPLIMSSMKNAGIADPRAQLYMFFYYAGPSLLLFTFCLPQFYDDTKPPPSRSVLLKAAGVAIVDIAAQSLNYTGAGVAGATIFAIVYSSVTVWTALFSRWFLHRLLTNRQWGAIALVFLGLCLTAWNATNSSKSTSSSDSKTTTTSPIAWGTLLILLGSCMHGSTYVMSEAIMQPETDGTRRKFLYPRENAALQSMVACIGLGLWQCFYTLPRWNELIQEPLLEAKTTIPQAVCLLLAFALANLLHSLSFYFTLAHYPGGSTSAGVFKGLQAVLVFVVAHWLFCDAQTAPEMCWSIPKMLSLVTVVGGVILFTVEQQRGKPTALATPTGRTQYESIAPAHV